MCVHVCTCSCFSREACSPTLMGKPPCSPFPVCYPPPPRNTHAHARAQQSAPLPLEGPSAAAPLAALGACALVTSALAPSGTVCHVHHGRLVASLEPDLGHVMAFKVALAQLRCQLIGEDPAGVLGPHATAMGLLPSPLLHHAIVGYPSAAAVPSGVSGQSTAPHALHDGARYGAAASRPPLVPPSGPAVVASSLGPRDVESPQAVARSLHLLAALDLGCTLSQALAAYDPVAVLAAALALVEGFMGGEGGGGVVAGDVPALLHAPAPTPAPSAALAEERVGAHADVGLLVAAAARRVAGPEEPVGAPPSDSHAQCAPCRPVEGSGAGGSLPASEPAASPSPRDEDRDGPDWGLRLAIVVVVSTCVLSWLYVRLRRRL